MSLENVRAVDWYTETSAYEELDQMVEDNQQDWLMHPIPPIVVDGSEPVEDVEQTQLYC